jgi:trimethylamine---corrinoid protein Co-methyltransferase
MKNGIHRPAIEKSTDVPHFHMLSDEKAARIHDAAIEVLEKTGLRVATQEAIQLLADAGCHVVPGSDIVKVPRKIVADCLNSCPKEITMYDRQGSAWMQLGCRRIYAGIGTTCIYIRDLESGKRREAELADMALVSRVFDALPNLDFATTPLIVKPTEEISQKIAAQAGFKAMLSNTTKPIFLLGENAVVLRDMLDMAAAVTGGFDNLRRKPFVCVFNSIISPLVFDADALDKYFMAADRGIPARCGSSPLSGGTAPVTTAGMLVVCIAESLGGIIFSQLRSPGAPVFIGNTPGIMDMKTGNLSYSSPETSMVSMAIADMAHFYGLPVSSPAAFSSSMDCDMQAALELMMSIYSASLAGSNLIAHIGGLEAAMTFSLESAVLGDEIVGMVKRILKGIPMDDDALALNAIHAVGPAGHHLDTQHTFQYFKDEQWQTTLLNRKTIDVWSQEGCKMTKQLVKEKLNDILDTHQPEPLPDEVQEQLTKIIDAAK